MIDQVELMNIVNRYRDNAVVVPAMRANVGWAEVSDQVARDVPASGAMGKTNSFALGVALARPDEKVIIFDGDGSLLMNLGALVTIANKAPRNLYHFVIDNGVYATTGGQEVPGAESTDYEAMGRSAGYAHSYSFDDLEDFATQAEHIMREEGPTLIAVKTVPNIRYPDERMGGSGRTNRRTPQAIQELMEEFGIQ